MYRIAFIIFMLTLSCSPLNMDNHSYEQEQDLSVNLYVFIAKKIIVKQFSPQNIVSPDSLYIHPRTGDTLIIPGVIEIVTDMGLKAKYEVVENVFNDLKVDTIEFVAYDHYGHFAFENHEYVMLYLSYNKEEGIYEHQKYQYNPVRKNKKGIWVGRNGETIKELYEKKRNGVLKARGVF